MRGSDDRGCRLIAVAAVAAALVSALVMRSVVPQTIDIVRAKRLLPRWDLATHLGHGWLDYHLLVTGQIHRLLGDLWMQGYWPPGLSVYLIPFFVIWDGELAGGLWSSVVAFVLVAALGAAILVRQWGLAGVMPSAIFVALIVSSPFMLAYATVAMTEMLGALVQLVVLYSYVRYRQQPSPRRGTLFASSLTALFFVKYNYFLLLAGPLLLFEAVERTSGRTVQDRWTLLRRGARRVLRSFSGRILTGYFVLLGIVTVTGGLVMDVLGQRISFRSIGASGHIVLYALLIRTGYLHSKGRIDWNRWLAADPLMRPLLLWFVVPAVIWLAAPYPNHLKDFGNLVVNRPLGEPTVQEGLETYASILRQGYFYSDSTLAFVAAAFLLAAVRYARQPPLMRFLVVCIPVQLAAIMLHQTRFPRFLLLTVVLLCLTAAGETGRWGAGRARRQLATLILAPGVVVAGVLMARYVVAEPRFSRLAFEHYSDSPALRDALNVVRRELTPDDRLLIIGHSNDLSPALLRWELGPPSGVPCYPSEAGGASRLDVAHATRVLLFDPMDPLHRGSDPAEYLVARRAEVMAAVEAGHFALRQEFRLHDLQVSARLYDRTAEVPSAAVCR